MTAKLEKLVLIWKERHLLPSSTVDLCLSRLSVDGGSRKSMSAAAAASSTRHASAESLDIEHIVSALQQVCSVSLIYDR
jgi:hypothetical protein